MWKPQGSAAAVICQWEARGGSCSSRDLCCIVEVACVAEPVEREEEDDTTAAESSSALEDLRAPLLSAAPSVRRRSLAARLRRRLSASGSASETPPADRAGGHEGAPRLPTKGILRRQKVHCCSRARHLTFGVAGTESSEGSPEHRPMSPGRFCKRALGRVFGLGDSSRHHRPDGGVSTTVDEEEEPREPKAVSIAEPPERSPASRRRGEDVWRRPTASSKPRKPPLVFGGTFPIDEPVGPRGSKSPFRSVVENSLSVATFPVDAFCCAAPNLCRGHHRLTAKSSVASTSESEPESRVSSSAGNACPLAAAGPSGEAPSPAQPKWKGSSFLHFLDSKVHKS
ncbi:uncharacterized protein LOC144173966 [Haemaphysalis longicornis]